MFKAGAIIIQITGLYIIYLIGIGIQKLFHLFIPGSVIGMIILFILLVSRSLPERWVRQGTGFMIRHLPFFFIPATVGIISYAYVFKGKGILLIPIVLVSTMLVMIISGTVTQWMGRKKEVRHD
jgi:holin-like protein